MAIIQKYIKEIIKATTELKTELSEIERKEPVICFRGENKDYGETKLTPTLFRDTSEYPLDIELIELLSDYGVIEGTDTSLLSKTIDGQHYISVSRLLDITFSMLPALYFATCNNEIENKKIKYDSFVYIFGFPATFSPNSEYINKYYDEVVKGNFTPFPKDFKVITHSYNNQRIRAQNGGFILFPGRASSKIPKEYYKAIKIDRIDIEELREDLENYFCITESNIFPEKDKRRNLILKKLKTSPVNRKNSSLFENELDYYLMRIEFEVKRKHNKNNNLVETKRFLRRESSYLKLFLKNNRNNIDKFEEFEKKVELQLALIRSEVEN
ncbi:FRG domain-containing protein [Lactococcus lactis]|uniref:FRG domain-containing protein n=1 Tax=Lactococcus lactis TaxID=1358 RepID=UPI0015D505CF|nr:FRG domain-containing protein [Lactococcus lactis]GFO79220.1 hypothetical protein LL1119B1_12760 [Lactococcus lactis]